MIDHRRVFEIDLSRCPIITPRLYVLHGEHRGTAIRMYVLPVLLPELVRPRWLTIPDLWLVEHRITGGGVLELVVCHASFERVVPQTYPMPTRVQWEDADALDRAAAERWGAL